MNRALARAPLTVSALLCFFACTPAGSRTAKRAGGVGKNPVELRTLDDRPAIGLVERDGDPRGAVAIAVAHDFGSEASAGLAQLLKARLVRAGFSQIDARPSALGFVLTTLVTSPADAAHFVEAVSAALATPITDAELPRTLPRVPTLTGAAQTAVFACSGELGATASGGSGAPEPPDARALEAWRARLLSPGAVAFSAVGKRALLDALATAVASTPRMGGQPTLNDKWPDADVVGAVPSAQGRLTLAYRLGDPARALEVARLFATPGSVLSARLLALDGDFRLDRVVATSHVRGACLRVDVRSASNQPRPRDVARAASVVDEETRPLLDGRAGEPQTLDDAVVRPSHPGDAAAAAAWRALAARLPGGQTRRAVSWLGAVPADGNMSFERALTSLEAARQRSTLERRARIETGQGELFALVASPCGTLSESGDDAGLHLALARAIAQKREGFSGVSIEPWITPDSVGLLAHAPRASASESADQHARRIGDALGRALVATRIAGTDVAETKADLLQEIGPAGQQGYFAALDAASGGHPSWLDPRGTWRAVSALETATLDARRRLLLSGPLRLAVLANSSTTQAEHTAAALERWTRPYRSEVGACAAGAMNAAKSGELSVEIGSDNPPRTYLVLPLARAVSGVEREAEWTVFLLNRSGGWLEQTLGNESASRARASLLGGKSARVLMIEVQAPDADRDAALAKVRSLMQRLSKGGATSADADAARRHFEARDAERALDPRARVVDLWRGAGPPRADAGSWKRFQTQLGAAPELVVHAKTRP
ncbi:MAG: hypothetical protein IPI67_18390 [Myxococcales bacterium]|nr:hypothetical protein [Myxococcales bacterium]